ncbi:MAG: cytochrome b/b6 domain-containing protein [Paludibacterium sp.]|uniref:cytochrome b/b6 domain-containing protein n=1 Tax=Paludibacterium sp. TaxID=1917523 RepID=UPI0025E9D7BE|nr:cytochrome b/b6 domain-containing protein [Paludibacterium sp.]MBV8048847.1 cytochrome b/b6 domain-containing protein [Paludibacterium sp.]MBV8646496.1 cytochrome b/b6 domain-containing protein [Paludibacterium sp.]
MKQVVAVWDLPTRLFHWGLVGLFAGMWYTGSQGGDWLRYHIWCGEGVAVLLLFRMIWGFFGSQTARFSDFLPRPGVIRRYLRGQLSEHQLPGHNPLGGLMVLALILVLVCQVATGLFASDVDSYLYNGPLAHLIDAARSESVTDVHKTLFNLILLMVGVHVAAVLYHRVFKRHHLIGAMLSGRKAFDGEVAPLYFAPLRLALISLLVSAGVVLALVVGAGG